MSNCPTCKGKDPECSYEPEPQRSAKSELVLPEIYKSCAHPQSVWFNEHWRPIFKQMKLAKDEAENKFKFAQEHYAWCLKEGDEERDELKRENAYLQQNYAEAKDDVKVALARIAELEKEIACWKSQIARAVPNKFYQAMWDRVKEETK